MYRYAFSFAFTTSKGNILYVECKKNDGMDQNMTVVMVTMWIWVRKLKYTKDAGVILHPLNVKDLSILIICYWISLKLVDGKRSWMEI